MKQPKVAVLVLNYNGLRWVSDCLSSALKSDYSDFEVCLVDNGSSDGSVDYVKRCFPRVRLICHSINLGFAKGYNQAIKKIDADYVLLLNSDTQVLNQKWIRYLVEVVTRDPRIAAVACKMVSMGDHLRLDSVGGMGIPYWRGFVDIGREELDHGQYAEGFEPFAFCGGATLLNYDIFTRFGGFDERFFMYFEDVDLSWRFRLLGFRVGFAPEARIAHFFSGSAGSKSVDALKLYYCHRNLMRSILKNCGSSLGWALSNYFIYSMIISIGYLFIEPQKTLALVKTILWNLFNFKDSYTQRLRIQFTRMIGESELLAKMYPNLARYQSAKHATLSHILNILFRYSQYTRVGGR